MLNQRWPGQWLGQVRLELSGKRVPELINRCVDNGFRLQNIRKLKNGRFVCELQAEDVKKLRPLLKQYQCKMRILHKSGAPFFIKKWRDFTGILIGLIVFVLILFLLSNIVWKIEIRNAGPQVEEEIRRVLQDMGVRPGTLQFFLPPKEDIQYEITRRVERVTWVGASLNGTTYTFRVVEKKLPKEHQPLSPRHLVAEKEAVIANIYVEKGKAMVEVDDYVQKGDILISGFVTDPGTDEPKNEETKKNISKRRHSVAARGKVWGKTWYTAKVSVPLETIVETKTGRFDQKLYVFLFGHRIPIWGFHDPEFVQYTIEKKTTEVEIFGWELFTLLRQTIYETKKKTRTYEREEAIRVARQIARQDLLGTLEKNARIQDEKILRTSTDRGKVNLTILFTVIEEITVPKTIIQTQGD